MKDKDKTKEQLVNELVQARQRIAELEELATAYKRTEEERIAMQQKILSVSHLGSIGEMASGIAHEINNPLTSVIGFADLLMQKHIPEFVKEDARIIKDEAERVASIVDRLLTSLSASENRNEAMSILTTL